MTMALRVFPGNLQVPRVTFHTLRHTYASMLVQKGVDTRVYFLDREGKVKYESGLGPYGLSPEDLEKALSNYLEKI